ncbi:hypothetical protein [Bacillus sp. B15-48]|uniref:hypothetical protein n=1 Tax=Bacillus sp. B15-48 TaxID=1548601 RepID=UPI001EF23E04|nr:hypothetical protein [Bacillus sp. B15-48]
MKKNHRYNDNLLYIHLNDRYQYVLSSGIEFVEFYRALTSSLNYLLLLKHRFDDGDFNRHTLLDYVPNERISKLIEDDVGNYGDFCWMDFEEMEGLNVLAAQELAEILYLGHTKHHLKLPFYNQLANRYAYLAHDDGWFNKIYYRNMNDFYKMLSQVIPGKVTALKPEKNLLGVRKKRDYPPVNKEILKSLTSAFKEGAVFSLKDIEQNRVRLEIPLWIIGDYTNMDDMYDEFSQARLKPADERLVFDKKLKEWSLLGQ